jgi:hypothetical protein
LKAGGSINACKKMRVNVKTACMKEANANRQNDLAEVKKLLGKASAAASKRSFGCR